MINNLIFALIIFIFTMVVKVVYSKHGKPLFLLIYCGGWLLFSSVLYPLMVKQSHMKVFSLVLFSLPIIFTIRAFEVNLTKERVKRMRGADND